MKPVFSEFANLLAQRLSVGTPTTEDSVRYTLFAAMLANGVKAEDVVLEYPHPAIPRAQVDTWLPSYDGKSIAIEFKYDRDPPGGKNQPKTQKAGSVFRDIHRLLLIGESISAICYFVYVTTNEMAIYFKNPNNGYDGFFALADGQHLEIRNGYFFGKPATFMNALGGGFEADLLAIQSQSLPADHSLRIYQVSPL